MVSPPLYDRHPQWSCRLQVIYVVIISGHFDDGGGHGDDLGVAIEKRTKAKVRRGVDS